MIWKDWRVYAVAAAITIAGLVYSCNKRLEVQSSWQLSDVKVEKDLEFSVSKSADEKISRGIERMEYAGAHFNARRLYSLFSCADANKDNHIDDLEAELMEPWLDPDSVCGRMALPYSGPECPPEPVCKQVSEPANYKSGLSEPWRWTFYVKILTDENEDNVITKDEVFRMMYKMKKTLGDR